MSACPARVLQAQVGGVAHPELRRLAFRAPGMPCERGGGPVGLRLGC